MAVYKNQSAQKLAVYAYDTATGAPKTADAASITAQISLDGGAMSASNDTNPTELDATNAPGIYLFDLTQAETDADLIVFCATSATSGVVIEPVIIYTEPQIRDVNLFQISRDGVAADSFKALLNGAGAPLFIDEGGTNLSDFLSTIDNSVDAVLLDTSTNLPASLGIINTNVLTNAGTLTTIQAKTDQITSEGVSVTLGSNIASDGQTLTLVQGEAMLQTLNSSLSIAITDSRLTSAITSNETVPVLRIAGGGVKQSFNGVVESFDDETNTALCKWELTATDTASLPAGIGNKWELDWKLAGSSTDVITSVIDAPCIVKRQIGT